jgi:pimeloyl-ACP methyl ester carboxylesterase
MTDEYAKAFQETSIKDNSAHAVRTGHDDDAYLYRENHSFSPEIKSISRLFTSIIPCVAGVGYLYQTAATARDLRNYPPPGAILDIDGRSMHLQTAGSGPLTVVLEAGLGGMSSAWAWVQHETAEFSRVVSYDRAGLGWSESDKAPKTALLAAIRLRTVLRCAEVMPPYVLVGHSMGGLLIRVFADLFPDEVAGMVQVDAAHPDQNVRSAAIDLHMRSGFRILRAVPLLAQMGYIRLTGFFNTWVEGLPPRQAGEAMAFLSSLCHLRTTRDESLAWETVCREVRATGSLGDIPLAVVTACQAVLPGHPEMQEELTSLSCDSFHMIVKQANHVTLITQHEHAQSVVEAIRIVVERGMTRLQRKKLRTP